MRKSLHQRSSRPSGPRPPSPAPRRRFLQWLAGVGAAGIALPLIRDPKGSRELDLREADFYRPHDLAG